LDQHTTEELEHFCESKGILLKRNDKQKQDSEKGKERLTASTPASDGWKKKLITLIQQYRVQEEEEYDEMCGYEAEPFLATNMSANEFKEKANELLIAGQYEAAVRYYTRAIKAANKQISERELESEDDRAHKAIYYANRALAHLKWGNFGSAVSDSMRAIELDPFYPKGYYRLGITLMEMNQHRKALVQFGKVLSLQPGDKDALRKMHKCEKIIRSSQAFDSVRSDTSGIDNSSNQRVEEAKPIWSPASWVCFNVPTLRDLAASTLTTEITKHMEFYRESLKTVPVDYMKQIMAHMSWSGFQRLRKIPHFAAIMSNTTKYNLLKQQEDHYRTLFVRMRDHPVLSDPSLMLVNPHEDLSLFDFEDFEEEERSIPMIMPVHKRTSGPAVVSFPEFQRNLDIFTEGQLRQLNWNNIFLAGGSVLASIMPTPLADLRGYFHKYAYKSSDIDLFIYGLNKDQANAKACLPLQEIFDSVKAANPKQLAVVRTLHAITIVSHYPRRHIQIVLRLYKSPAEILMGFDVDCCCIGYDGINVLMHPRCARALKMQYNLIDISRRSPSYEYRLYKYAKRGFSIAVPGFDRSRVPESLFKGFVHRTGDVLCHRRQGLARLLMLEHLHHKVHYERDYGLRKRSMRFDTESRLVCSQEKRPSDYSALHIPYGPFWMARDIIAYCNNAEERANDFWYRVEVCNPPRAEIRPFVCGKTMQEVLASTVCTGEPNGTMREFDWDDTVRTATTYRHVSKDDMWVTENPGSQDILYGSFNPTVSTFEEWVNDAYADSEDGGGAFIQHVK